MHAHAIYRDQSQTDGAGRGKPSCMGMRHPSTVVHHKFQRAVPPSRKLAGARRSGPFIRAGWAGDLNVIAAIRMRKASGLDEWAATHAVEADQSQASGAVQAFSDQPEVKHSSKSSRSSTYASTIAQKRGQGRGFFSQGREFITQGGGGADE